MPRLAPYQLFFFSAALPAPATAVLNSRSGGRSVTPEQWRHWGSMEREVAMIKVVRTLQLKDPAGVFSRQLDEKTLQVIQERRLGRVQ